MHYDLGIAAFVLVCGLVAGLPLYLAWRERRFARNLDRDMGTYFKYKNGA